MWREINLRDLIKQSRRTRYPSVPHVCKDGNLEAVYGHKMVVVTYPRKYAMLDSLGKVKKTGA